MIKFIILISGFLFLSNIAVANDKGHSQEIRLSYKAYWAGLVVSKVYSRGLIDEHGYQMNISYEVTGLAAIFSSMKNKIFARGIFAADGSVHPLIFDNQGSWGRYSFRNHTVFRLADSKIITHKYSFNFRKKLKYIPISNKLGFGPDMVSFYLGLTRNHREMNASSVEKHQHVFGGFFVLDVGYRCIGNKILDSSRSVYHGKVRVCRFRDKVVDGGFARIGKDGKFRRKSQERSQKKNTDTMEPVPLQIWYGNIDGVDQMVPVYSEFPLGWGKVRVYLAKIEVITR